MTPPRGGGSAGAIGPPTPPALARLGAERTLWQPGHTGIRWQVPDDARFGNTAGTVHGGYLCVVADALLGSSLATLTGPGERVVNPDFHASFLAPLPLGAVLVGEGKVARRGRNVSFLEASLRREDTGEALLTAMSLGVVLERREPKGPSAPAPPSGALDEPADVEPAFGPDGRRLPLWFADFGARLVHFERGAAEIEWPLVDHRFDNRGGSVQGGYLAFVADSAMGFALISGARDGATSMSTTTLGIQFHRPVAAGATLRVRAAVERQGTRFGFARCEIESDDGSVASARATGLVHA